MGMWTIPKEETEPGKFSEEEINAFIGECARGIVKRHLSVPAIMTLEMAKPVSFLGYSSLVAFGPLLDIIVDPQKVEKLTCVMGDRKKIEALLVAIEEYEKNGLKEGDPGGHKQD